MLELFPNGVQHYLVGGLLIGVAISLIFLFKGIYAGASSVFSSSWSYFSNIPAFQTDKLLKTRDWRLVMLIGTIFGAALYAIFNQGFVTDLSPVRLFIGGLLVGLGTRMASGCTSGHGVCGNASLSRTSMKATITFLMTGMITAGIISLIIGWLS